MAAPQPAILPRSQGFARPWLALCAALAVHVFDEATTGFLAVYNATILAARSRWPWFPMPVFTFREWIVGLGVAIAIAFALTPWAASNARPLRVIAAIVATLMMLNGFAHIAGTIRGGTFPEIRWPGPMPGFYSSPLLLASSAWVFIRLRATRS